MWTRTLGVIYAPKVHMIDEENTSIIILYWNVDGKQNCTRIQNI